jgi:hypothetical protein
MKKYAVTFYDFGDIIVEAQDEKSAKKKAVIRAKQLFISEVHTDLEIAAVEETIGQVLS